MTNDRFGEGLLPFRRQRDEWKIADRRQVLGTELAGEAPVLLTSPAARPFVRGIIERFRPQTTVLSQGEIHPRVRLKTVGSV